MIELARVPHELFAAILAGNLREVGPSRKLFGHFLEGVQLRLRADACWLSRAGQGEGLLPGNRMVVGDAGLCDEVLAAAFLRREHPAIPPGVVLSSLLVHGRPVAVVGVARREGDLGPVARRALGRLCGVLAEELERREEERVTRVLDRIREKIVSELRPRDLAYQILDGLHLLVDYDHSSAFLAYDPETGAFRIEAEKIVWTKAKSPYVGREIRLPAERIGRISRAIEIYALDDGPRPGAGGEAGTATGGADGGRAEADTAEDGSRQGSTGAAGDGGGGHGPGGEVARELLGYHREEGNPPVTSLLSAPLFHDGEFLGLLKIAAWQRSPFGRRDLAVVERFLPAAAASMRNAQVNRSLQMQAVEAEVKASLVTLSHVVAHDVNNAVGSILPLAQQMRFDLRHGPLDLDMLDRDLGVIIDNARLCQRIFSNMLRVAGAGRGSEGPADAAQVVAETLPFLLALAGRRGIEIALDLAPDLPLVHFRRQDLQHIVLNLVRNAFEAMAETGGRVDIALRRGDGGGGGGVEMAIADDGPGIPPDLLSTVQEPFFSTRPGGTGLGLALCRALAWQNGGSLLIESPILPVVAVPVLSGGGGVDDLGELAALGGTRVTLRLGAASRPLEGA
jgi:signal transduction histidine kinase